MRKRRPKVGLTKRELVQSSRILVHFAKLFRHWQVGEFEDAEAERQVLRRMGIYVSLPPDLAAGDGSESSLEGRL
jgi:hypothetical protein